MSRKHTAGSSSAALRAPWRKNFTTLAPTVRRAARYALQIVARNPSLHHRFADDDFLGALWSLALLLVEPSRLARLQADCDAARDHLACLAAALDLRPAELQLRLYRHRSLGTLDLAKKAGRRSDLEDFIQAGELLEDILALEPATPEALLAAVVDELAADAVLAPAHYGAARRPPRPIRRAL